MIDSLVCIWPISCLLSPVRDGFAYFVAATSVRHVAHVSPSGMLSVRLPKAAVAATADLHLLRNESFEAMQRAALTGANASRQCAQSVEARSVPGLRKSTGREIWVF